MIGKSDTMPTSGWPAEKIPPLRNGDRLTFAEFERRYEAMPHLKKAELIEGVVYLEPATTTDHGQAHSDLAGWLGFYRMATPHLIGSILGTVRLDLDNEVQPDVHLRVASECGGQARVGKSSYVEGAPELIAEVTFSGASYDLHDKLNVYRRSGVREYVAWRLEDGLIDWFISRDGHFVRLSPCSKGVIRSEFFPGLWLDPLALVRGNLGAVQETVKKGLTSPEHAAFVAKLLRAAEIR
jgi:Uma2 family endonuclease